MRAIDPSGGSPIVKRLAAGSMKFFLRFVAPVLAILWLANVHPLGAALAILLCVIRCAFKSRTFSHIFANLIYDILKSMTTALARLVFRRGRGW